MTTEKTVSKTWIDFSGKLGTGILVSLNLLLAISFALKEFVLAPTFHLDGAFQTFSGLSRLLSGDLPGRDFFPYLGIGTVEIVFPIFFITGQTVTASVFSANVITLISLEVIVATIVFLLAKTNRFRRALYTAPIPILLLLAIGVNAEFWKGIHGFDALLELSTPGNSLRPIRALAPYLLVIGSLVVLWVTRNRSKLILLISFFVGIIAALWSNDYGLISSSLFAAGFCFYILRFEQQKLRKILLFLLGALVSFFVVGMLFTAGHFIDYLKYNLSDVRGDQFWYFGNWATESRIFTIHDTLKLLRDEVVWFPVLLAALIAVRAFISKSINEALLTYLGIALLIGGAVGTFGGHTGGYFWPARLWATVVSVTVLTQLIGMTLKKWAPRTSFSSFVTSTKVFTAWSVIVCLGVIGSVTNWETVREKASTNAQLFYSPELGGYIDKDYKPLIDFAITDQDLAVEEYFGIYSAIHGPNQKQRVDAVIHALGVERPIYKELLESGPSHVITTSPLMSDWVSWNITANWWFYRSLFKSYSPEYSSPTTLTWTKTNPVEWPELPCEISLHGQRVSFDAPSPGIYELQVNYEGPGINVRKFSRILTNINVVGDSGGYVPLDPGATEQQLPIYALKSGINFFDLRNTPEQQVAPITTIIKCKIHQIRTPTNSNTLDYFKAWTSPVTTPFDLNDKNWERGVSKSRTRIVVRNTPQNRAGVEEAVSIWWSPELNRKIQKVYINGDFIEIELSGKKLNPLEVGNPIEFSLKK